MKVLGKILEVIKAVGRYSRDICDWNFIFHVVIGVNIALWLLIIAHDIRKFFGI